MTIRNRLPVTWLLTLLALGTACVRVSPELTPAGPAVLAIVTWNLNAGRGDLPRLLDDLVDGRLTAAPPRHFVVLLQEAIAGTRNDARTIATRRRLASFFGPVLRGPERTSGNAMLSSLPLESPIAIDLPEERQPRGAIAATIRVEGYPFLVVGTHLENRLGWRQGLFGDRARGRQAEALLRALPPRGYGVLGGDMNTMLGATEPAWRMFLERFPDTPERPAPTFRERLVLDHLFFDLPPGWSATRHVLEDRYGSDHHPVLGLISGLPPRPRS